VALGRRLQTEKPYDLIDVSCCRRTPTAMFGYGKEGEFHESIIEVG
jgi:hypothetical protein